MSEVKRPGGETAKRISKVFFICDTSGSMLENGKIGELNNCLREALPHIKKIAKDTPGVEIQISVLTFDSSSKWVVQNQAIEKFVWSDLKANPDGETHFGAAFELLAMEMNSPSMPERGLPPLAVLITDGFASDNPKDGLNAYLSSKWGGKSSRRGIGIGKDADMSVLVKFINNNEIKPISANNPEQLAKAIKLVSTVALKSIVKPPTVLPGSALTPPTIPAGTIPSGTSAEDEVW